MPLQRAEIAARAYTLWELRGKPLGSPEVDWYEAKKQLERDDEGPSDAEVTLQPVAQPLEGTPPGHSEEDDKKTETTPPDGPMRKPRRPVRKAARKNRENGAARD
jgi:hypothetical protein